MASQPLQTDACMAAVRAVEEVVKRRTLSATCIAKHRCFGHHLGGGVVVTIGKDCRVSATSDSSLVVDLSRQREHEEGQ